LAVGPVGVDLHACRGRFVAAVSVSRWEWDVWHKSVRLVSISAAHVSRTIEQRTGQTIGFERNAKRDSRRMSLGRSGHLGFS
jgi:hypothetical protein